MKAFVRLRFILIASACWLVLLAKPSIAAPSLEPATMAINSLGLDLLRLAEPGNALLSPYSIQSALAMTYAGAKGSTRDEMQRILYYPANDDLLHGSFAELNRALDEINITTTKLVETTHHKGAPRSPVVLKMANGLFGEASFSFEQSFLSLTRTHYGATLQPMDFINAAGPSMDTINSWVEKTTEGRIQKILTPGSINADTRLILVNAVYLKAPWQIGFKTNLTKIEKFNLPGGKTIKVPTMNRQENLGFAQREGFRVVSIPYLGGGIRFVIFLPDKKDALPALEKLFTPEFLSGTTNLPNRQVMLHLPKFRIESPALQLAKNLNSLGVRSALNLPAGSADFSSMAPKQSGLDLALSDLVHKAFLSLDEAGTEAAAATAERIFRFGSPQEPPKPIEVHVDHPFIFAIQHDSGACLFLGRVVDPR